MFCERCGAVLPEGANFCPNCGVPVARTKDKPKRGEIKTVQFRCSGCGNVMEIDPDSPVLRCRFCGSNELIQEDTDVTVERIRRRTKRDEQQAYKDVQTGWQRIREKEIERDSQEATYKREKEAIRSYRRGPLFYLTIFLALLFGLFLSMAVAEKQFPSAAIAALQVALCLGSILMGLRTIKEKGRGLHTIMVILAIFLIVPFAGITSSSYDKAMDRQRKEELRENPLVWPTTGLAQILPEPETTMGKIDINYDDKLYFSMYYVSKEEYEAYVQRCIEEGFTIEAEKRETTYSAYNDDGYDLRIHYIESSNQRLWVNLEAPVQLKTIIWPDTDMVNLLPRPKSALGEINTENASHFSVSIGNTTQEQFAQYVNECIAAGFDTDYSKEDTYFTGDYGTVYHLRVEYRGFNTIEISIEKKNKS